jgi:hypothetical protein
MKAENEDGKTAAAGGQFEKASAPAAALSPNLTTPERRAFGERPTQFRKIYRLSDA